MNSRQQKILTKLIEEYIKSAEPVASGLLTKKCKLDVSSATIRNELAELEKEGFVIQPHIAAGRIPTEKAYNFYLNEVLKLPSEDKYVDEELLELVKTSPSTSSGTGSFSSMTVKNIAKKIAELTGETIIVAFSENDMYYTGVSNLFNQPEFQEFDLIHQMSEIIDQLDDKVSDLFENKNEVTNILIGSQNPLGSTCSFVYSFFNDGKSIFGLLGPMRMDYEKNISLVEYVNQNLK